MPSTMLKTRVLKSKNKNLGGNVRNYFKEYCDFSSIHGFKYFGEDRTIFERIWWILVFIICLSGCSLMIYKIYAKYESSPVIVTFATKETPIYEIPFPAVTICPEIKSNKDKFNFTKVLQMKLDGDYITDKENLYFDYLALLCDGPNFNTSNDIFGEDFYDVIDEVKPEFLHSLSKCDFMGTTVNCSEIFVPIMTDEGICYSFNILDRRQVFENFVSHYKNYQEIQNDTLGWTLETGYFDKFQAEVYPRRALLPGASNGLTIQIRTPRKDKDPGCKGTEGYKVLLHLPSRMPRLDHQYFRVPLDQAVVAAVQPTMMTTSETVKSYDVNKRDCYFSSEKKLMYFKEYGHLNCELECLTNLTLKDCACVNIFMPRDNETEICGIGKYECMKRAEYNLQHRKISNEFKNDSKANECKCLPLCTDLSYYTEISQTNWDWEGNYRAFKTVKYSKEWMHLSLLTVYFKFNHFISSQRQDLYGPTDFLANFGGLLGLFTGFSILSLMEIIYFLTMRIFCNIKLYGKWTGLDR